VPGCNKVNPGIILVLIINFFVVICLVGSTPAQARNTIARAMNHSDSLATAVAFHRHGDSLLEAMGYMEAEKLFDSAFILATALGEMKLAGKIANNLAECYSMTGRGYMAETMYLQAYKIFEDMADTNAMAVMLINLGDEYAKTGRMELAAETELTAIRLKEAAGDFRYLAFYYQKLGELFINIDKERWEFYALKALDLARTPEYTTLRATVAIYNDLGSIHRFKGDFVKAEAYYDTMYRISAGAGYRKGIATSLSERALLLYDLGRYDEALSVAKQSYELIKETDDDYQILYKSILIGRILMALDSPQEAITHLQFAVDRAEKAGLLPDKIDAMQYLFKALKSEEKWKQALDVYERSALLKDSLSGIEVMHTLNSLQIQFETEKKQQLIDSLSERNIANRKLHRLMGFLLFALGVTLVMTLITIWLRNKTIRQNKALQQKENEVFILEQQRLKADNDFKARELTTTTLHLINKNELLTELKGKLSAAADSAPELRFLIKDIEHNINHDKDWQDFSKHFEDVHPDFFKRLRNRFPEVTAHEERMSAFLLMNLNTKEISRILHVTTAAVDKSRNRLRKKLGIGPETQLNEFLTSI
jgi:tetratricopeptide (TPR) repeat protein